MAYLNNPGDTQADFVDHWRCRFINRNGGVISDRQIYDLLLKVTQAELHWNHIEKLQIINNQNGWTKAQGEE